MPKQAKVKTLSKSTTGRTYFPPSDPTRDALEQFREQNPTYIAFREKGLDKVQSRNDQTMNVIEDIVSRRTFRSLEKQLLQVDLSKGPILRQVKNCQRQRAVDPEDYKLKEFLTVRVNWIAKDPDENEVNMSGILEGMYNYPKTRTIYNGRTKILSYEGWESRYDIPFSKEKVDELIDSNFQIQPTEMIMYVGHTGIGKRYIAYDYDQFVNSTWEEFVQISRDKKGRNPH